MAKQKQDDMAAALDAMMSGAGNADEPEVEQSPEAHEEPTPEPAAPAGAAPTTPSPRQSSARPASVQPPTNQPARPARPAAPARPAVSSPEPATPSRRQSLRPASPTAAAPSRGRPPTGPAPRQPLFMQLGFRQTIIPPLLTGGVLLLIFAALPLVMADDSAFAAIPGWVVIMCLILGVALLATGALNMLLVNKQLNESA